MRIASWLLVFICSFPLVALGQEQDSTQEESVDSTSFLWINTDFQPVSTFLARDFGQSLPAFSFQSMYLTKSGFYVSGSWTRFFDPDLTGLVGGGLGYSSSVSKKLDLDLGAWLYSGGSYLNSVGADRMGVLQGVLGWDWNVLYSTFQVQAILNQPSDFVIASNHSRYFQLNQLLWGKGLFSFEPKASFYFGTTNFYTLGNFVLTEQETLQASRFTLQAFEFVLPFSLTFQSLELKLDLNFLQPLQVPDYDSSSSRFFLSGGISYLIPFQKKTK